MTISYNYTLSIAKYKQNLNQVHSLLLTNFYLYFGTEGVTKGVHALQNLVLTYSKPYSETVTKQSQRSS
jgi:hypothetical protein